MRMGSPAIYLTHIVRAYVSRILKPSSSADNCFEHRSRRGGGVALLFSEIRLAEMKTNNLIK